jgi:hypothetical protein
MNRKTRRKANSKRNNELVRLSNGLMMKVEKTINLDDPNLAPEHRDGFIAAVKGRVAELDECIASYYRHRGQCGLEGCDCGLASLAEQTSTMCGHLRFIKERFGEIIAERYPAFNRFLKEGLKPAAYESLTSHKTH